MAEKSSLEPTQTWSICDFPGPAPSYRNRPQNRSFLRIGQSISWSCGEHGSRGLRFILDRSRVNVAISRAKCLAIVVADPRIANTPAGSIAEMMLLNLYCKLLAEDIR